jgi:predicted Zn finger-like uncharacterized protein
MDVRCDRCRTEYEFDEARLTEAGVAVKCTACGNVFKVSKPSGGDGSPIDLEQPRQWKVRRQHSGVYALKDLPELQRWIVERRVSREDEVSLSGEAWRQLSSMPELASFFDVVEAADRAQQLAAAGGAAIAASPARAMTPAPVVPVATSPAEGSASWEASPQALPATPAAEPAWAGLPSSPSGEHDLAAAGLKPAASGGIPMPVFIGGGIAVAALVAFFLFKPSHKAPPPAPATPPVAVAHPSPPETPPAQTTDAGAAPAAPVPTAQVAAAENPAPTAPSGATAAEATPPPAPEGRSEGKPSPKPEGKSQAGEPQKGHDFGWYMSHGRKLMDSHPGQSLAMFEQASQLDPSAPEPDSSRGIAYSNMEQWPKAIGAFEDALKKKPSYNEAVMGLAEAHRYKGDKKEALAYYRHYLELSPDGPDAPAAKAQITILTEAQ